MMKKIHITEAKKIADRIGADAVIVLAFSSDTVAGASYGQTKALCNTAGRRMHAMVEQLELGLGEFAP